MATYPTCSECGEILWELAEREAEMCFACQDIACQNELEEEQDDRRYKET